MIFFSFPDHDKFSPDWSLERRASSGQLVWRKEAPNSKIRFRFHVEVLEFEKDPREHTFDDSDGHKLYNSNSNKNASPIMVMASCIIAIGVTVLLPWYLLGAN